MKSTYEESTTQMFKKVVREGDTVVDIGANIGYFTLLAARLAGAKGRVYAFEPDPVTYRLLTRNIGLNRYGNVVPVQKAVSDSAGMVKLYLSPKESRFDTITQYDGQCDNRTEFVEVETIALDEFFNEKDYPIDTLKMDIEGAEMLALSGMGKVIRENKNLKMFVEFHPAKIRHMGFSPEEFARHLLEDYGFSMFVIGGDYSAGQGNVKIDKVEELMNLCKHEPSFVNLFLERR